VEKETDNANVASFFFKSSLKHNNKDFLFFPHNQTSFSYRELEKKIKKRAAFLKSQGIGKGDCVNILLPNCPDFIISFLASLTLGAVANPINSGLKPDAVSYILNHSEGKILITSKDFSAKLKEISSSYRNGAKKIFFSDSHRKYQNINEEESVFPDEVSVERLTADDTAILIYTSGTTGRPKGVMLTHGNLSANAKDISSWLKLSENDRLMCIMPYFHLNGIMITLIVPFFIGGSLVLKETFSASDFWSDVSKFKISTFGSVATMLNILNRNFREKDFNYDISSLKYALCGSAPVPVEVIRNFEKNFNAPVIEGYGLTESTCRSTFNPVDSKKKSGSAGLPLSNEIKIIDGKGNSLGSNEKGEIIIRGKNIMKGYFKDPETTSKTLKKGWLHTGDIGWKDSDGFYYIVDRKDDLIIKGGENIYPREIDEALYGIGGIAEAATIGVPDNKYGENIKSFVKLENGSNLNPEKILEILKNKIDNFRCPREIEIVENIPKGPTGKLLKRVLKK